MRRLSFALLVIAAALLSAPPAFAQGNRYVVIVQGASGDPEYAKTHRAWVDALSAAMRDRFRIERAKLIVLAEQPKDAQELRGTAENVRTVFARLAKESQAQDLLFVMLIGHGTGDAAAAKFNLVGPDLTSEEWSGLLKPVPARIAFVDSTSSSFPFLSAIAGPGRVVVTATSSYAQRYHTVFPEAFIQALTTPDADADKNGRVSLLEAFTHASMLVARHYEQDKRLATENALIEDTGDGKGRMAAAAGEDGAIAAVTYLDQPEAPTSSDPETRALQVRQQALTEQIDELRRRKAVMAPALFESEFERLIVELAMVSRDVRSRMARK